MTKDQLAKGNMAFRPKGMDYKGYKSMCEKAGADAMDEDSFGKLPEGEPDGDEAKKGFDFGDLQKALIDYEAVEKGLASGSSTSREALLKARLDAGTISGDERKELGRLWSGEPVAGASITTLREPVQKSLMEAVHESDEHNLVDASPLFKALVEGVEDRLGDVQQSVLADGRSTRELLKAQGSVLRAVGGALAKSLRVIDDLEKRLAKAEGKPQARRSVTTTSVPRDMSKGGAGNGGEEPKTLTKLQVNAALEQLAKSAAADNDQRGLDEVMQATTLFQMGHKLPPNVAAAVNRLVA